MSSVKYSYHFTPTGGKKEYSQEFETIGGLLAELSSTFSLSDTQWLSMFLIFESKQLEQTLKVSIGRIVNKRRVRAGELTVIRSVPHVGG